MVEVSVFSANFDNTKEAFNIVSILSKLGIESKMIRRSETGLRETGVIIQEDKTTKIMWIDEIFRLTAIEIIDVYTNEEQVNLIKEG